MLNSYVDVWNRYHDKPGRTIIVSSNEYQEILGLVNKVWINGRKVLLVYGKEVVVKYG